MVTQRSRSVSLMMLPREGHALLNYLVDHISNSSTSEYSFFQGGKGGKDREVISLFPIKINNVCPVIAEKTQESTVCEQFFWLYYVH